MVWFIEHFKILLVQYAWNSFQLPFTFSFNLKFNANYYLSFNIFLNNIFMITIKWRVYLFLGYASFLVNSYKNKLDLDCCIDSWKNSRNGFIQLLVLNLPNKYSTNFLIISWSSIWMKVDSHIVFLLAHGLYLWRSTMYSILPMLLKFSFR